MKEKTTLPPVITGWRLSEQSERSGNSMMTVMWMMRMRRRRRRRRLEKKMKENDRSLMKASMRLRVSGGSEYARGKSNISSNGRRGWPENANTWEPLENLQSCFDVIESFENRLKSGNHYRKRKRKQGISHVQAKKKQCSTSTSSLPCVKVGSGYGHLLSSSLVSSSISKSPPLEHNGSKGDDHLDEVANCPGNGVLTGRQPENMSVNVLLVDDRDKEADLIRCNGEGALADKLNAGRISTHIPDAVVLDCDGLKEELQKAACLNLAQTSRSTGARKRKSGFVRRFKQESTSHESGDAQNSIARCIIESGDKLGVLGMEDAKSLGDDLGDKKNLVDAVAPSSIAKIIKAIGYSASVSNNIQDVLITFLALRSDGREVVVDSKFLKVNNPLLLISFYEQHLRYNPST
ncbi:hypothetical protein Scep_020930 [Stephania cephalantha]|uniref:Chromo shadow domain-containing protein n=1 Tax=Stephania cephalantha TaxID=152367 RepID=A0AAP0I106_9MAGN